MLPFPPPALYVPMPTKIPFLGRTQSVVSGNGDGVAKIAHENPVLLFSTTFPRILNKVTSIYSHHIHSHVFYKS